VSDAPARAGTVRDMIRATVTSAEVQYVAGRSNKRYVGHTVDTHAATYTVFQYGPRGRRGQFLIEGQPGVRTVGRHVADEKLYDKIRKSGYAPSGREVTFTVNLPSEFTESRLTPPMLQSIADAYQIARAGQYRPVTDLLAAASAGVTAGGDLVVLGLDGFAREAKSEPVAAAVAGLKGLVPWRSVPDGRAALVLPAETARRVALAYDQATGTATVPAGVVVTGDVLETALSLWGSAPEFVQLPDALEAALLVTC
jgi:hypothetical protein